MKFSETALNGAFLIQIERITDDRGWFGRAWCQDEFRLNGLNPNMVQLNTGFSRARGTLRGMHYQLPPSAEAKFVRCTRGALFDVIVDLRDGSATKGKWSGIQLTPESGLMLYVPEGFAHGYQTLEDDTEMYYLTSAPYDRHAARGVRHNDPAFGIQWPLPVSVISEADMQWPDFKT